MWFVFSRHLQSNVCVDINSGKFLEEVFKIKLLKGQSMHTFVKWFSLVVKNG